MHVFCCQISRSLPDDEHFADALTRHPTTFLLTDAGRVEDLFISQTDPLFAANIKRAIVSLLQLQRPPTPDTTAYKATDSDIIGTCTSQHTVGARGADHVVIQRTKQPSRDCESRAVHHGNTPDADHDVFTRNNKGMATTTHYFHRKTGSLDKVRFAEEHAAALHGDPRTITTASSTGYLRRLAPATGATDAIASATGASATQARARRDLHEEFGTEDNPVVLEPHSLAFQHGDQTHPSSSLEKLRRTRRDSDGSDRSHADAPDSLDAGSRLSAPELRSMHDELLQWLAAVQATPTASGASFHRACVAVREHDTDLVPILDALARSDDILGPAANSVLAGAGSDLALAALWPRLASGALGRQPTQGLLMTMASVPRPTAQLLAQVRALISTNTTDYQVSVTGALVLGALVRQVARAGTVASAGAREEARLAVDMLIQGLRHATHEEHRTLFIHALGNAGDADALPYIEGYTHSRQSRSLRLAAIESVRHMPAMLPATIRARRGLRGQLLDTENDDEVRITAYRTLAEHR